MSVWTFFRWASVAFGLAVGALPCGGTVQLCGQWLSVSLWSCFDWTVFFAVLVDQVLGSGALWLLDLQAGTVGGHSGLTLRS